MTLSPLPSTLSAPFSLYFLSLFLVLVKAWEGCTIVIDLRKMFIIARGNNKHWTKDSLVTNKYHITFYSPLFICIKKDLRIYYKKFYHRSIFAAIALEKKRYIYRCDKSPFVQRSSMCNWNANATAWLLINISITNIPIGKKN